MDITIKVIWPKEPPNSNYRYVLTLSNCIETEDYFIGDVPKEPFFLVNNVGMYPKQICYPKYLWEKVK